jgi:energy-coupling factor transporter ATP-binding protein EcfA2
MTMELGCDGLAKSYKRKRIFDGLDFRLRRGELLLLSGANGAGKTTLMRILAGLERADAGRFSLDGRTDGWTAMKTRLRRHTVYLHQTPYMFDGTVFDNAAYPLPWLRRRRERARVLEALRWSGLEGSGAPLRQGLSGGERQRLALARALISRPELPVHGRADGEPRREREAGLPGPDPAPACGGDGPDRQQPQLATTGGHVRSAPAPGAEASCSSNRAPRAVGPT